MYFKKYVNDSRIFKSVVSVSLFVYKLWLTKPVVGVVSSVRGHEIPPVLIVVDGSEQSLGHHDYNTHLNLCLPIYGD